MAKHPHPFANPLALDKTALTERCPKCHGLGRIMLMSCQLAPDVVDTCPACLGYGTVPKRVGYQGSALEPADEALGIAPTR